MDRLRAGNVLLISDACFSGSLFQSKRMVSQKPDYRDLYRRRSRWALTSGNLTPVADIAPGSRHSAFAVHLLNLLRRNDQAYLTPKQIVGKIAEDVARSSGSHQYPRTNPIKEMGDEGGSFVFWLKDGADDNGVPFKPPWEAEETDFLVRVLRDLEGRKIWIVGGGEPAKAMCEELANLGLIVDCDLNAKDRNRRQIAFYCPSIPVEAGAAIVDLLGLKGYQIFTHENNENTYDSGSCGGFNEITLWN